MQLFYLLLLAGTLVTHAISFPGGRHDRPSQVLYFLENDPSGAKLAAVEIMRNGSLGHITETSTAGKGLQVLNTATESPLGPDSLASQGAVAIQDDVCVLKVTYHESQVANNAFLAHLLCQSWLQHGSHAED